MGKMKEKNITLLYIFELGNIVARNIMKNSYSLKLQCIYITYKTINHLLGDILGALPTLLSDTVGEKTYPLALTQALHSGQAGSTSPNLLPSLTTDSRSPRGNIPAPKSMGGMVGNENLLKNRPLISSLHSSVSFSQTRVSGITNKSHCFHSNTTFRRKFR